MPDTTPAGPDTGAQPRQTILAVGVHDVTEHPKNPRIGNVPVIAESLRVLDQYRPIVVQKSTGYVLAGNHTLKAARELGWSHIDAIVLDIGDTPAARILAVDNRSADLGEYDDRALAELLENLPDLEATGYDQIDVEAILAGLADHPDLDMLGADHDAEHGTGADSDLWPVLRLSVPPGALARWKQLVADSDGDEAATFASLVGYDGDGL